MTANAQADNAFIEEYRGFVQSIVNRVTDSMLFRRVPEDLFFEGMKGLLEARSRFDPERGVQFKTFAYYRVRGAIIDGIRKSGYLSPKAHARLKAAEAALLVGEELSEQRAALAEPFKDKPAEAIYSAVTKISAGYLLASIGQDEQDAFEASPEGKLVSAERAARLHEVLDILPDRERALVEGFYLEGRRFDEIAKELGISKSWASRLHTKALERLREELGDL